MSVPQHTVDTLPVPLGNPEPHLQVLWSKVLRRLDFQKTGGSQENPTPLLSFSWKGESVPVLDPPRNNAGLCLGLKNNSSSQMKKRDLGLRTGLLPLSQVHLLGAIPKLSATLTSTPTSPREIRLSPVAELRLQSTCRGNCSQHLHLGVHGGRGPFIRVVCWEAAQPGAPGARVGEA